MKKMVDGKVVDMTAEEIAKRETENAAFEAELANPSPRLKTEREEIEDLRARLTALEKARP
jgi:septal ring factor EnvC (AmiA/AmiB activator)